jgi:protein-S-isoprenylcysteine O-methyltransferase Ste14
MHILAGALLIAQSVLIWVLDKTVDILAIDILSWVIWFIAIVFLFLPMSVLRKQGQVAKGKSYTDTAVLAQEGLYGLIRHPQYFGWALMYLAAFLFNPRWSLALLGIAGEVCVYLFTLQEERMLVEKFGEAYSRYMEVVPRYNILLGIVRRLKQHGE